MIENKILRKEETEKEQMERERKECILEIMQKYKHIKEVTPFIEGNKVEYFYTVYSYIEVYCKDVNNFTFNAIIQDHQFIKRNITFLEVEELIISAFSIMKNYKNYPIIDHDFIKFNIDIFSCIDISIEDVKHFIKFFNVNDIAIKSDLIIGYNDGNIIFKTNIKDEIPSFEGYTESNQKILLKYYYDKLEENNIKYKLID